MRYFIFGNDEFYALCDGIEPREGWVEITEQEAQPYMPQPDQQITIDANLKALRSTREAILNRLQGIAFAAQLEGDSVTTAAYLVARQGLLDITANLPATLPEIEVVVMQRYAAIVSVLPASLLTAFAGMDV